MLPLLDYQTQSASWPQAGRHILAHHDAETIVVYQAYSPLIGHYAAKHQRFGDGFALSRMSWIKPNFLWMMYRSSWGTAEGQEVVLAITLRRAAFDEILRGSVPSSFWRERFATEAEYKHALATSNVRMQWDPDHAPGGAPLERRAVQLGLRGDVLHRFAEGTRGTWVTAIEDVSELVATQRTRLRSGEKIETPAETVVRIEDAELARRLRIDG